MLLAAPGRDRQAQIALPLGGLDHGREVAPDRRSDRVELGHDLPHGIVMDGHLLEPIPIDPEVGRGIADLSFESRIVDPSGEVGLEPIDVAQQLTHLLGIACLPAEDELLDVEPGANGVGHQFAGGIAAASQTAIVREGAFQAVLGANHEEGQRPGEQQHNCKANGNAGTQTAGQ